MFPVTQIYTIQDSGKSKHFKIQSALRAHPCFLDLPPWERDGAAQLTAVGGVPDFAAAAVTENSHFTCFVKQRCRRSRSRLARGKAVSIGAVRSHFPLVINPGGPALSRVIGH